MSLNPGAIFRPFKAGFRVWSPLRRQFLFLTVSDMAVAMKFSAGAQAEAVVTDVAADDGFWREETSHRRSSTTYLKVQQLKADGILVEEMVLNPSLLAELVFGQHAVETLPFLETAFGPMLHTIRLRDLPLMSFFNKSASPNGDEHFEAFLDCLIKDENLMLSEEVLAYERGRSIKKLEHLYSHFADLELGQKRMWERPFQICRRPDGEWLLLEEADRACAALALGHQVRALVLDVRDYLGRIAENPSEFFGSMRGNLPYHSIFHKGQMLVAGMRNDLYQRLEMVRSEDLAGKRVVDLGSNVGMNCFIAVERGAVSAQGFEVSAKLVRTALRLNAYFAKPCRFRVSDLNAAIADPGRHDTAFFFALLGHLRGPEGVLKTLREAGVQVVYFETHCDIQPQGDVEGFLGAALFKRVEFLGNTSDNTDRGAATRKMYRCEVKS